MINDSFAHLCGWIRNPAAVRAVLATMPRPYFADAAPHLIGSGSGKTVLLYEACQRVNGGHLPAQKQDRGTCVSRGWSGAIDYLQCVDIATRHLPEEFQFVSHAAIYGMAKEIGGDLSSEDGAVGAWAAKAVSDWGVVTNADAQDSDGNDRLAVEWGARGCPAGIKDRARQHLAKSVSLVRGFTEARDAICNGYPVPVCSDQGFTMTRDRGGFCRPQGVWNHCMLFVGYRDDRPALCCVQSWGQNCPDGPLALGQPDNSFWVEASVADRMLRQEDSFAVSRFDGFPARELSWLI